MPAGRPPKWKSVEELKNQIEAYFISIEDPDKPGYYLRPPTITGLALALGTTRQTLLEYEGEVEGRDDKDPRFADTIKEAKVKCEQWVEENAMIGKANATFSIFNLKNNYGWRDKTEQDVTSGGKPIVIDHDLLIKNATNTSTEADSEGQA